MEISIDLKLMHEIVFRDNALLIEMLEEWMEDSNSKIQAIEQRFADKLWSGLFNKIHELKTNFSMIHCYAGIQCCEKSIELISIENTLQNSHIETLKEIVEKVNLEILKILDQKKG